MNGQYEGNSAEYILNGTARLLKSDGGPCIVCGAAGGNCAGEMEPPQRLAGSTTFPSLGHQDTYVVKEDIWRKVQISHKTSTQVLVFGKGAVIPLEKAEELGLQ